MLEAIINSVKRWKQKNNPSQHDSADKHRSGRLPDTGGAMSEVPYQQGRADKHRSLPETEGAHVEVCKGGLFLYGSINWFQFSGVQ